MAYQFEVKQEIQNRKYQEQSPATNPTRIPSTLKTELESTRSIGNTYVMYTNMDDVVNPPLEEIDGAKYRMNLCDYPGSGEDGAYNEDDESEFQAQEYDSDQELADMPAIEKNADAKGQWSHRFRIRLRIPKALHGYLIGSKGQTRMRLEQETRTKISIPKKDEEGDVVISSSKEQFLRTAYPLIRSIIVRGRNVMSITHFVSIPLNTPDVRERFAAFREQVLECYANAQEVLDKNIFQKPEKFHLTVAGLTLLDEEERQISCRRLDECLKAVIEPLLQNRPLQVRVKGVNIMNDDPTRVKVLFAEVHSSDGMLQRVADEIFNFFKQDGLVDDKFERDFVKLHATLMNTRYLEDENEESESSKTQRRRRTFDASRIFENFKNFDFGVVMVNSLHLSQLHAYSEDGYYLPSNRIKWA